MKLVFSFFVLFVVGLPGFNQSMEGVWMGTYEYDLSDIKSPEEIEYRRTSYLFDFYSDSEFLAHHSHKDHTIFKYKKLRSGKYRARNIQKKRTHFYIEIIDEERLKLSPTKIRKNDMSRAIILDKVSPVTIELSFDSLLSILASSQWSLKKDFTELTFEFIDIKENKAIISRNGQVSKSSYGLVVSKGFYFFAFMDHMFFTDFFMQLNELNSQGFISTRHNLDIFEDSKSASTITLKKENPHSVIEYEEFAESLVGSWAADVTEWKQYFIIFNDTTKANYLSEWLMVDSVLHNNYVFEFRKDSSFHFINQGHVIQHSEEIIFSDTLSGKWLLSPTLKYIELIPDNPDYREYEGTFIYIESLDGDNAKFGFSAFYETLFNNLTGHFEFEKVGDFGD
jgi:hypothetical protein